MTRVKVHSDQSAVAHIILGWQMSHIFYNQDQPYEYILQSPEQIDRPSNQDILNCFRLSIVEEVFYLKSEMTVIAPGLPRDHPKQDAVQKGMPLVLLGDHAVLTRVGDFEMARPAGSSRAIRLQDPLKDIHKGMQVWGQSTNV